MRREPPKPKPRGHGQQRRRALQHAYQARRRHPVGEHRGEMNETDGKDEQEEKLHQRPLAFAALPSPPIEVEQEQGMRTNVTPMTLSAMAWSRMSAEPQPSDLDPVSPERERKASHSDIRVG